MPMPNHRRMIAGRGWLTSRAFAETVLDWSFSPKGYAGTPEAPVPKPICWSQLPETGRCAFRPGLRGSR